METEKKKKSKFIIKLFIIQYTNEKYDIAGGEGLKE